MKSQTNLSSVDGWPIVLTVLLMFGLVLTVMLMVGLMLSVNERFLIQITVTLG